MELKAAGSTDTSSIQSRIQKPQAGVPANAGSGALGVPQGSFWNALWAVFQRGRLIKARPKLS
uniref:Uncharacterized protein n=1 Tax=Anguilla anguilla TaxID=7936 RepID=A0A0E9SUP2_ANGAN